MSVMEAAPTNPRKAAYHAGFRVVRHLLSDEAVQRAQELLIDEFGDAIEPIEDSEWAGLRIVSRGEVGRAILAARAAGQVVESDAVMDKVAANVRGSRNRVDTVTAQAKKFAVRAFETPNSAGMIWLPASDKQLYKDRAFITGQIDKITGAPYEWSTYGPRVDVAKLMDPAALEAVASYKLEQSISLHVGEVVLLRA